MREIVHTKVLEMQTPKVNVIWFPPVISCNANKVSCFQLHFTVVSFVRILLSMKGNERRKLKISPFKMTFKRPYQCTKSLITDTFHPDPILFLLSLFNFWNFFHSIFYTVDIYTLISTILSSEVSPLISFISILMTASLSNFIFIQNNSEHSIAFDSQLQYAVPARKIIGNIL